MRELLANVVLAFLIPFGVYAGTLGSYWILRFFYKYFLTSEMQDAIISWMKGMYELSLKIRGVKYSKREL